MKRRILTPIVLFLFFQSAFSGKVTWIQYFYAIKQIFPDEQQVTILIPKEAIESEQKKITRAAAISKIKVKLFPVEDTRDIGSEINLVREKSVLIVYDDPLFMNKNSMLYILSKANDKKIAVVSNSEKYGELGAFLTLVKNEAQKLKLVVNLKFKPELAAKFTPEFQQKLGISQVLH